MRADSLSGLWSQPFFIAPPYTRTFSTQFGFSIDGDGEDQWVLSITSILMTWDSAISQLRRISGIIVNDDAEKIYKLYQKDTQKATILSTTVKLPLTKGKNTLKVGGLHNGTDCRGADLDRIVVYPPEEKDVPVEDPKDL